MGLIVQASVVEDQDAVVIVCSDQLRQSNLMRFERLHERRYCSHRQRHPEGPAW